MKDNLLQEKYFIFRAKNKDPEAYSKVYDIYVDRIYRFVYFKVSNAEDAQDLTSEVFLKTWQYIIDGKEIKNLNALFYKVARNLVIDYYRKASQKDVSLDIEIAQQTEFKIEPDQLAKAEQMIRKEKLEEKLNSLKDEYKEIIILRYIEQLSIKEIAEILEKKGGAVRVILYRAINALRELMGDEQDKQI